MDRRAFFHWRYVKMERRRGYKRWAVLLLLSIPLFSFIRSYVIGTGKVTDISMLPTLPEGGYFLINKAVYHLTRPRRGDIVVLRPLRAKPWRYVKRVVGLAGETVQITDGYVYVNGRKLAEPYAIGLTFPDMGPLAIEKNSCFVLGDNRGNSEDSRFFGSVPLKNIEGRIKSSGLP